MIYIGLNSHLANTNKQEPEYLLCGEIVSELAVKDFITSYYTISDYELPCFIYKYKKIILSTLSFDYSSKVLGLNKIVEINSDDADDLKKELDAYMDEYYILHNIMYIDNKYRAYLLAVENCKEQVLNNYIRPYVIKDILQTL